MSNVNLVKIDLWLPQDIADKSTRVESDSE